MKTLSKQTEKKVRVQCNECGKKFKTKRLIPTCPSCGGADVVLTGAGRF